MSRLCIFFALFGISLAAVAIGPLEPKPDKYRDTPGCYIKDLGQVIPLGKKAPAKPPACMEYSCGETHLQYFSCGAVATGPGCKTVADKSKPYPHCCPKIEC